MSEPFEQYGRAIAAAPPLSRDEERDLGRRACKGDVRARHALVQHNLGIVFMVARKQFRARGSLPLDDIIQEGMLGLARAVETFNPEAGNRFATYAVWWIAAYMRKYMRGARSAVKGRAGTVANDDFSLDAPTTEDGELTYLDALACERPSPEVSVALAERDRLVREVVSGAREKIGAIGVDVAWMRVAEGDLLREVGDRHSVSREYVRQVEGRIVPLLRNRLAPLQGELDGEKCAPAVDPAPARGVCRMSGCGRRIYRNNLTGVCGYCHAFSRDARRAAHSTGPATCAHGPAAAPQVARLPRHACDLKTLTDPDILDAVHEAERRGLLTITQPKDEEKAA